VKINNACYTGALCLYIFVLLSMFLIVRPPHLLSICLGASLNSYSRISLNSNKIVLRIITAMPLNYSFLSET